ncbi:MAG: hypothetical protein ACI8S6_002941 [Myxococcota bacterium]|jgi:uncharacterized protein (DUF1330 family)
MHLEPTNESVRRLFQRGIEGPIVMLNLLRFREVADYSSAPHLAPEAPISGQAAYDRYMRHTASFLAEAGGELLWAGAGSHPVIGPAEERWDRVLLVRHQSLQVFLSFAKNEGYLAGIGHRTAALEDSRLLPLVEQR